MCSRRRRFESCSRIFLRAILRKKRESEEKKERKKVQTERSEGRVRGESASLKEKKRKKTQNGFTSTPPARPPWPP